MFVIYKTTNLVNGKYYIGKHQTNNLDDGYIGSGLHLKNSIQKHGRENFVATVIDVFETEKQMNLAERILVVPDHETNYNLCPGGQGGFGYINKKGLNVLIQDQNIDFSLAGKKGRESQKRLWNSDPEFRKRVSDGQRQKSLGNQIWLGRTHSDETKEKMRKAKVGRVPWNKGKPHSSETKLKISNTLKHRGLG